VIYIVKGCRLDGHMLGTKECLEEFIFFADSSKKPNFSFRDWQAHDSQTPWMVDEFNGC